MQEQMSRQTPPTVDNIVNMEGKQSTNGHGALRWRSGGGSVRPVSVVGCDRITLLLRMITFIHQEEEGPSLCVKSAVLRIFPHRRRSSGPIFYVPLIPFKVLLSRAIHPFDRRGTVSHPAVHGNSK
jgi:hypothetical protein